MRKTSRMLYCQKPQMANRCKAFKNFESNFYQDAIDESNKRLTPFASSFKIEINGKTIGITSLNSAWRCSDSNTDHNKNIIGTQQIIDSLALISDCDIKIAYLITIIALCKNLMERKWRNSYWQTMICCFVDTLIALKQNS